MKYIYLGGPISGLTYLQATDWRMAFQSEVDYIMRGLEKFACRWPVLDRIPDNAVYGSGSEESGDLGGKATIDHDRWSVQNSDVILMNFTHHANRPSIGCAVEFGWADILRKPVITILPPIVNPHNHAWIHHLSMVVVPDIARAIAVLEHFA